jgi:DnaJ-class molecular chaperone
MIGIALFAGAIAYVALSRKGLNGPRTPSPPAMPLGEAYLILGLSPGAGRDDVFAAYRNLMKRLHPDRGGTSYLAARVNEAKDALLKHVKI